MLEQAVAHDRRQQPWRAAGGKHYEFLEVPLEAVAAFQSAFANGCYFNNHIRNHVPSAPRPRHSLCSKDISAIATSRLSIANGSDVLSSVRPVKAMRQRPLRTNCRPK
ncbi:KTSC domain-containing protein [Mesorhizobium sp. M8A.F.Ca.ET.059.01.1.1]|nr:KTSC domain-containing protein [Mesorhizobium sp. M8A.F.Ca.ET.059.01.1.1]